MLYVGRNDDVSAYVRRDAEPGDLVERHERVPQHDDVADVVDAAPPGPARELRVLARRQELVVLAGELRELLDHDRAGGHVDAERQRLGREHDLQQPGRERLLDRFLHRRHHARRGARRTPASRPASHES